MDMNNSRKTVEENMAERRADIKMREMLDKILLNAPIPPTLKQAGDVLRAVGKIGDQISVFSSYAMMADEETPDYSELSEYLNLVLSGLETFISQHTELAPYVL